MTVTRHPTRTSSLPQATLARAVLWAALAVNVLIVWVMFFAAPPSKNGVLAAGKFIGLHAALLIFLQLILVARVPWLDRRIGMDRLTSWHRWVGFTLFWALVTHAMLIVAGFSVLDKVSPFKTYAALAGVPASLIGMLALFLMMVAVAASIRAARRRVQYETWHAIHLVLYFALALALVHQFLEGTTFRTSALTTAYWWTLWVFAVGAFLTGRVIMPLWRNSRHQLRVAAVVPESDNTVSVHVTGRRLDEMPALAGQFMIWRFPGFRSWWQVNPFSLSAAPDGRSLRLTAKAVGTGSAGLRDLPVGTRVFAEGPYGAFTALQRTRETTLLIAGGIGVTPIRALLDDPTLTGDIVVLYRVHTEADAVLLAEMRAIAATRGARLHLLTGRTGPGNQPLSPDGLRALVPDITERDVYVCGPNAMTNAVLASLRTLGVPRRQVHAERFALAS
ncbi:putative ferric reductase [Krasilnikovia cinnamomea]|uniref:Putative ferric reductase n=1 Tax=Krasilnikovia cinnamomea TaxID=349313 RepID=A0A4Q7ZCU9_9ACTN|nr:ferredoxin reductase family protein [Krasilnikovia cinnamomea]RZU48502.1 putative ferric reductase [Krasilnikovia cinnamomea]